MPLPRRLARVCVLVTLVAVSCTGTPHRQVATTGDAPAPPGAASDLPEASLPHDPVTTTTTPVVPPTSAMTDPAGPAPSTEPVEPTTSSTTRSTTTTTITAATTTTTLPPPSTVERKHLVFADAAAEEGLGWSYRLMLLDLESGDVSEVARDVSFDPSPDATGRRIAYRDFHNRIWVHDLVTGDKEMLTPDSEGGAQPVFSPDGSHVAYIGGRSLSVMAADGTDRKALATLGPYNPRPSWSPDSRRIAFHSDLAGGTRIFTINADGTELREVFAGGEHPVWSPDGGSIAFLGGDSRIWIAPAAGGGAYPLTSQGAVASRLSWSPDSRSIAAFVADPEIRKWVLHTFEVHEGTNRREGPPDGDAASTSGTPVWSPDGASIVYQGSCGTTELNNLCLVDRTTGQLRLIDHYAAGGTPLFVP